MSILRFVVLVTCASVFALGCESGSDDDDGTSDGATAAPQDASTDSQTDAGASAGACSGCTVTEGCVQIDVSVKTDGANLPWKVWPDKSSGTGRLFAGVFGAGVTARVKSEDDVNLRTLTGKKSFDVCAPTGKLSAFCFLDDKQDGELKNVSEVFGGSSDYIDTCTMERQVDANVTTGSRTTVACTLSGSCD